MLSIAIILIRGLAIPLKRLLGVCRHSVPGYAAVTHVQLCLCVSLDSRCASPLDSLRAISLYPSTHLKALSQCELSIRITLRGGQAIHEHSLSWIALGTFTQGMTATEGQLRFGVGLVTRKGVPAYGLSVGHLYTQALKVALTHPELRLCTALSTSDNKPFAGLSNALGDTLAGVIFFRKRQWGLRVTALGSGSEPL